MNIYKNLGLKIEPRGHQISPIPPLCYYQNHYLRLLPGNEEELE